MAKRFPGERVDAEFLRNKVLRRGELISSFESGVVMTSANRQITRDAVIDCGEYGLVALNLTDLGFISNPPAPRRAAAVLEDGTTFYLSNAADFRAFYERLAAHLKPIDVARLLVMYQTQDYQLLVEGPLEDDFAPARSHPLVLETPLVRSEKPLAIDFCSSRPAMWQLPGLFRWSASMGMSSLEWSSKQFWP